MSHGDGGVAQLAVEEHRAIVAAALERNNEPFPHIEMVIAPLVEGGARFIWEHSEGVAIGGDLSEIDGGLEITRLEIVSSRAIDTEMLRKIPLGSVREWALAKVRYQVNRILLADSVRVMDGMPPMHWIWQAAGTFQSPKTSRRGNRTSLGGDDLLHDVARRHFEICQSWGSRGCHRRLATELTKALGRQISEGQARQYVHKARERGFLERTAPGKANATLTEEFFRYMSEGSRA